MIKKSKEDITMRVDFHSHVVPGVDDGSKNTEMSVEMLHRMRQQGTDLVVATPHFYMGRTAPEEYLEKISDACYLLREAIQQSGEEVPQMVLGYEVYYFKGISQANFINLFTIGNSPYLLLELPTRPLSNADVEDIYRIRANQGLIPILAHVERYLAFESFDFLQDMIRQGELLAQINADSLLRWSTRKKALEFLKSGSAQFVGSDAHNLDQRAPHLGEAMAMIEKKAGIDLVRRIDRDSEKLIQECLK